jgi:hypothetical protein
MTLACGRGANLQAALDALYVLECCVIHHNNNVYKINLLCHASVGILARSSETSFRAGLSVPTDERDV